MRSLTLVLIGVAAATGGSGCRQGPPEIEPRRAAPYSDAVVVPAGFEFPRAATVGVLQPEVAFAFREQAPTRQAKSFRDRKERHSLALVERFALENGFTVLSRTLLGEVVREHGLQLSAPFDQGTVRRLGKLTGAEYLFVTSVDYTGVGIYRGSTYYSYKFLLRLIRVETGQVVCTVSWSGRKRFGDAVDPDEV